MLPARGRGRALRHQAPTPAEAPHGGVGGAAGALCGTNIDAGPHPGLHHTDAMLSNAPHPGARYDHDPAPLPDGTGESCARCALCGTPYIPQDARHTYCSQRCADRRRNAAHYTDNASARQATVAVRRAGYDPSAEPWRSRLAALRGRGVVAGWRELVGLPPPARGVRRTPREAPPQRAESAPAPEVLRSRPAPRTAPWGAPVGEQPSHISAVGVPLTFAPKLPTLDVVRRHLHGLVSHIIGRNHHSTLAAWALVPYGQGWGVVAITSAARRALLGLDVGVQVGRTRTRLTTPREPVRLRTPPCYDAGRYLVTVEALAPVVHHADGRTTVRLRPGVDTILAVASQALLYAGCTTGGLHVERVDASAAHTGGVDLGGHLGLIRGWVGRVVVECNAPAAWALKLCEHTGMGGRVAYGLGRVKVTVTRADAPQESA